MPNLIISDFAEPYSEINGQKEMKVSRLDVARAGITIGFPKLWTSIRNLGLSRFLELYFRTFSYLENVGDEWKLNDVFYSLNSSERKTISYFFGQAFAKLFAERYLNCIQVDDFNNHKPNIKFKETNDSFVPKKRVYKSNKTPREPDLIGFSENGFHILEAKGYSSGFNKREFQHAINQVSIVDKINGYSLETKTACFFDLSCCPFEGIIADPSSDDKTLNIEFDPSMFLQNYYGVFNLQKLERNTYWILTIGNEKFAGFRLFNAMYPRWFYGVDIEIFNEINKKDYLEIPKREYFINHEREFKYSIGQDGIIFANTTRNQESMIEKVYWI